MTAALAARDLVVGYRRGRRARTVVLDGVSLTLAPGQFACLIGPNGSGKSTLLRTCSGLQPPLHGELLLAGKDLRRLTRLDVARQCLQEALAVDPRAPYAQFLYGLEAFLGNYLKEALPRFREVARAA